MYTREEVFFYSIDVGGRVEWDRFWYFYTQVTKEEVQLEKALLKKNPRLHQFRRKGTECITYDHDRYVRRHIRWRLVITTPMKIVRIAVTLTSTKDSSLWDIFSLKNTKYLLHKIDKSKELIGKKPKICKNEMF
jgi:hypothetical protein